MPVFANAGCSTLSRRTPDAPVLTRGPRFMQLFYTLTEPVTDLEHSTVSPSPSLPLSPSQKAVDCWGLGYDHSRNISSRALDPSLACPEAGCTFSCSYPEPKVALPDTKTPKPRKSWQACPETGGICPFLLSP